MGRSGGPGEGQHHAGRTWKPEKPRSVVIWLSLKIRLKSLWREDISRDAPADGELLSKEGLKGARWEGTCSWLSHKLRRTTPSNCWKLLAEEDTLLGRWGWWGVVLSATHTGADLGTTEPSFRLFSHFPLGSSLSSCCQAAHSCFTLRMYTKLAFSQTACSVDFLSNHQPTSWKQSLGWRWNI